MSRSYKTSAEVPAKVLIARLNQLSDAIAKGSAGYGELTMRIPAEVDRDADIVISEAAMRLGATASGKSEIPEILFDGYAVYSALSDKSKTRTSQENVSDVLDAVVRLMREGVSRP